MIRAHGGSRDIATGRGGSILLAGILRDTTQNSPAAVHMKNMAGLLSQTTGIPREKPVMEGVLTSTVPASRRDTPELQPAHGMDKTASKMSVGATFAGPASGYGDAEKSKMIGSKKGKKSSK
jgi:hypothetical protein